MLVHQCCSGERFCRSLLILSPVVSFLSLLAFTDFSPGCGHVDKTSSNHSPFHRLRLRCTPALAGAADQAASPEKRFCSPARQVDKRDLLWMEYRQMESGYPQQVAGGFGCCLHLCDEDVSKTSIPRTRRMVRARAVSVSGTSFPTNPQVLPFVWL